MITLDAVYENGTLKLSEPLPFENQQRVRVTVYADTTWAQETAGIVPWAGDPALLERLALDPEFSPVEGP